VRRAGYAVSCLHRAVRGGTSLVLATTAVAIHVGFFPALAGCRGGDVLIGIEGNGIVTFPDGGETDDGSLRPPPSDADAGDADLGPCLADAGCPLGAVCEYAVDAQSCALPGECFALGAGSSGGTPVVGMNHRRPRCDLAATSSCGFAPESPDPIPGYSPTRPSCDAGEADAGSDAADPH
jgi:hypothetical protein